MPTNETPAACAARLIRLLGRDAAATAWGLTTGKRTLRVKTFYREVARIVEAA